MLMLRNEPADQWLSVLNNGNHRKDGYVQDIFQDGEIRLVVGKAGVRRHTATFSAQMHFVCSITHGCHSNICSDQLEDACSSNDHENQ